MSVSKKLFGLMLLLLVVCLWVASSTAIQLVFTDGFNKPFFLTYLSTSMFSLYLLTVPFKKPPAEELKKTLMQAVQFCPMWFAANYLFNLSLSMSGLSSITIISSSSGLLSLVLAVLILKDSPDVLKFLATFIALGGVAMIVVNDHDSSQESTVGDILAFTGAVVYASYSIFLKARTGDLDMVLFFGCVGAVNCVLFVLGFVVLNYSGFEVFEWPSSVAWVVLCLNGLFGTVISDLMWALSVRYLNPPLCTMGLTLTIPLSIAVQAILFTFHLTLLNGFGAVLVIIGFTVMASFEHQRLREYLSNENLKSLFTTKSEEAVNESFISSTSFDVTSARSSLGPIN
jgi:solute carrier family 35 protein F5